MSAGTIGAMSAPEPGLQKATMREDPWGAEPAEYAAPVEYAEQVAAAPVPEAISGDLGAALAALDIRKADMQTRKFTASFRGTMAEWARTGAKWSVQDDTIWQRETADGKFEGDIGKVLGLSIKINYKQNPLPVAVGFRFRTGGQEVKGNCYGATPGERFVEVAYAGQHGATNNTVHVAEKSTLQSEGLLAKYAHMTSREDLMEGTMLHTLDPEDVHYQALPNSPLAVILEHNADELGINWDSAMANLVDGKFVKIVPETAEGICDYFEANVLKKRPYEDLRNFEVEMVRRDGLGWEDRSWASALGGRADALMHQPFEVILEFEKDYVFHGATKTSA